MADLKAEDMLDQVHSCQDAVLQTLVGWPTPVIMAALTQIMGALVGTAAPDVEEARSAAAKVGWGVRIMAEDCFAVEDTRHV